MQDEVIVGEIVGVFSEKTDVPHPHCNFSVFLLLRP